VRASRPLTLALSPRQGGGTSTPTPTLRTKKEILPPSDYVSTVRFLPHGERGLVVELGDGIDPALNARVHALARRIGAELRADVEEVVPTYRSLLVVFDPLHIERAALVERIEALARDDATDARSQAPPARLVRVPVCYEGDLAPDLADVARHAGVSTDEVVRLHGAPAYLVYMVGFTPGFPYLGGMPKELATPRLAKPRTTVPAGAVAIGGEQTGIYPVASPGGWRIVGRTPLRLFDAAAESPFLLAPGDRVRFAPVPRAEFDAIAAQVAKGGYRADASPFTGGDGS
jgi:inhibitor of KinA